MALDKDNILVLNYNENKVCVDGANETYNFNPSNGVDPVINIMSLKDLQFINSNTGLIKTGWLTFQDNEKEEIFKELHIRDWESILTNEDIKEIMLNPSIEGLQKLIDISDEAYFDRVRIALHILTTDGEDVSSRVKNIVDARYKELVRKQRKTSIVLSPKDVPVAINDSKAKELEAQNAELKSQLDEMKAMMAQLMAMQNQNVVKNTAPVVEEKTATTSTTKRTYSGSKKTNKK